MRGISPLKREPMTTMLLASTPASRLLQRSVAASSQPLSTFLQTRLASSFSDSQWSSQSQSQSLSRGSGGPRRGPPRFGGGRPDRRSFDGRDRRPVLTRTNDGEDVPQLVGEGVYGIHSVLQALESGHRQTHALYMREEQTAGSGPRPKKSAADVRALERIKELAAAGHVDVNTTSKWMLNHITGDKPHQARRTGSLAEEGCVRVSDRVLLLVTAARVWSWTLRLSNCKTFTESERAPVILALDELHDPQNFGAILRSAHFLGCSAVVVSERNSAPLSPAVSALP
ncbi:hypothetical protein BBJ28_00011033 [Nothophytophthora sp. Chile5]|nr:hypothetical protein BBJ28_00011033 [Nothophytophthora sp. Chile5]